MASNVLSVPSGSTRVEEDELPLFIDDREQFVEAPGSRNRGGRGVLAGVLLGAGMWAAILSLTGIVKL